MLTVTKDPEGRTGIENIPISSVYYLLVESGKKRILVYVEDNKKYYMMGTLIYWATAIANSGNYKFFKIDRNTLINVEKIQVLDTKYKKAYFSRDKKFGCEIVDYKIEEYTQLISKINSNVLIL